MPARALVDEWTGKDVTVSAIERELGQLRDAVTEATEGPDLRTSVLTHMAWVPVEWAEAARETLAGLDARHPSRTLLLFPEPDAEDGLDAELRLQSFPLEGQSHHVCSEVIELVLRGRRSRAPASIVLPLLISDLPVFLRWRGQPPFGTPELEQLIEVADRLVVDSAEWPGLPDAYASLAAYFDRVAVSDIAWARGDEWRRQLATLWPDVAEARELRVAGPYADALLLRGWLSSRLGHEVGLVHERADELESVAVDGSEVPPPRGPPASASDLLSQELDRFRREPVYEASVGGVSRGRVWGQAPDGSRADVARATS